MLSISKILIIHSPHSGRSSLLEQAVASLRRHSLEVVAALSIAELDGLPDQGPHWKEEGIDLIVAAGGDGLVGGVITHIAESGLPLAILPLGTSNDIARSLGIPQELTAAVELLVGGQIREVDIGVARPGEQTPHLASADMTKPVLPGVNRQRHGYFAHALTLGLNVQFARIATNIATRQRYGRLTYPLAALEVLRNHVALEMDLQFSGLAIPSPAKSGQPAPPTISTAPATLHCRALQATIVNAPIFGGAWQLAIPHATLCDGLLDIIVIEDIANLNTLLANLFSRTKQPSDTQQDAQTGYSDLQAAELTGMPGIHHVQACAVTITTSLDPQDVTLDGEVRGQTPVHAKMAAERLHVVVPLTE